VLLGVLVAVVTMRGGSADPVTQAVYAVAAGARLVFAVWTAATAARGSITHSPSAIRLRVHQEGGVEHPWPPRSGFG
jgi:hypothetical protein